MKTNKLFKRLIVDDLLKYINTDDVLVLHGARQVGKTSILYYLRDVLKAEKQPVYYADLEDSRLKNVLDAGPGEFLKHLREEGYEPGKKLFVFIDEIQYLKNPSAFLKLTADHYKNLKLVVSGSSSFEIKTKFKDSLAGRTLEFEVFNLSFKEFMLFKGKPLPESAGALTAGRVEELKALYKEYALYGGYPKVVLAASRELKEKYLQQIIDTYIRKDIGDLAKIKDAGKFNKLLEVLAAQSGNLLNVKELAGTCRLAQATVEKYLFILENTYVIRLLRPFSGNLRSELFKVPKIFFYDTGLMQLLWMKSLLKEVMGNVFETSVFAELVKKYGKDAVFYWRSKDKKEIDFILKRRGVILPLEAKINFQRFEPGAIKYFNGKYGLKDHRIVGLSGEPRGKSSVYPWQV
ncbi:MAG: ATP-binding protein [Elusimicrobia bacterium]|nr:ATP-binding protein [Elusimicrobiota bacterium]